MSSSVLPKRPGERESVDRVRGGDLSLERVAHAAAAGKGCPQRGGKGQAEELATAVLATLEQC